MHIQDPLPCALWKVGDIVSRDGTDEHEILELFASDNFPLCGGDNMRVRCIKEPRVYEGDDRPWTTLGEEEINLARRYTFVRPTHWNPPHPTLPTTGEPMKNKPKRSASPASSQMHVPDVAYESFARSLSSALSIDPSEFKRASARSSKHLSRILANPETKKRLRKYCRDLIAEDKLPPNGTPRT